MIIASNIRFRSLADRIDAKLARFTNHSISSGSVRLRYRDEDGDLVSIDSDEAVNEALLDWWENSNSGNGQNPELLLFADATNGEPVTGG
jgi:cell division control protein 24